MSYQKTKNTPLKPSKNPNGYCVIKFSDKGIVKAATLHTIIAKTFLGPKPFPNAQVNHKDGNKDNNAVDNLEWVTPKENTNHAIRMGLINRPIGIESNNAKPIKAISIENNDYVLHFRTLKSAAIFMIQNEYSHGSEHSVMNSINRAVRKRRDSYLSFIWDYDSIY